MMENGRVKWLEMTTSRKRVGMHKHAPQDDSGKRDKALLLPRDHKLGDCMVVRHEVHTQE